MQALAVAKEEVHHSSLLLRARFIALVVVDPSPLERHCTGERPFSFGAHPYCATCQLGLPTSSQRRVSCVAQARLQSQPLGRRRSTQACCACAPSSASCGRLMNFSMTLSLREASFLRRAPVVRRASCDLQRQASVACLAWRRRAYAHCRLQSQPLGRRCSTRACCLPRAY